MHGWIDVLGEWSPEAIGVRPSYNVAPSRLVAGFPIKYSEVTPPIAMRWGMVPQWANAFESRYATFNARTESVAEKTNLSKRLEESAALHNSNGRVLRMANDRPSNR